MQLPAEAILRKPASFLLRLCLLRGSTLESRPLPVRIVRELERSSIATKAPVERLMIRLDWSGESSGIRARHRRVASHHAVVAVHATHIATQSHRVHHSQVGGPLPVGHGHRRSRGLGRGSTLRLLRLLRLLSLSRLLVKLSLRGSGVGVALGVVLLV